jgi:uncharacterized protein YjbJ (UPF0337 family)
MNWQRTEGSWKHIKGKVKERWGRLTDNAIEIIAGQRDQLVGKIQQIFGIATDAAEHRVSAWEERHRHARLTKARSLTKPVTESSRSMEDNMNSGGKPHVQHALSMVVTVAFALGLVACDHGQGPPSENVAKDIDRTLDEGGRGREQAASIADGKIDDASGTISEKSPAGGRPIDEALSAKVKSALSAEPGLKALAVDGNASSGAVTLYGTADTPARRDRAAQVALNVDGVKSVTNHLILLIGS